MSLLAHEVDMRLHGIDPKSGGQNREQREGTEMRLPGGAIGFKPKVKQ